MERKGRRSPLPKGVARLSHVVRRLGSPLRAPASNQSSPLLSPSMSQGPSSPTLPPLVPAFLKISKRGEEFHPKLQRCGAWANAAIEINKRFVDLEWQQRNRLAQGLQETDPPSEWARLTSDEITRRNRYINIDPWAGNRVRLRVPEGHNDYINASHMSLTCSKSGMSKRFIATQVGALTDV